MSGSQMFKVGAGLLVVLVVWSFLSPSSEDQVAIDFDQQQAQEPTYESETLVMNQQPEVAESVDIVALEREEQDLLNQEQELLRMMGTENAAVPEVQQVSTVESISPDNSEELVDTVPAVDELTPIVEESREEQVTQDETIRASLKTSVQEPAPVKEKATESKAISGTNEATTEFGKPIFRTVYFYDDNYDVVTHSLKIMPETKRAKVRAAKRSLKASEAVEVEDFRGSLRPDFQQPEPNQVLEDQVWKMQRQIDQLKRQQAESFAEIDRLTRKVELTPSSDGDLTDTRPFKRSAVVARDNLPLRAAPSLLDAKIRKLSKGEKLQIHYGQNGWYKVETGGGIVAWVEESGLQLY